MGGGHRSQLDKVGSRETRGRRRRQNSADLNFIQNPQLRKPFAEGADDQTSNGRGGEGVGGKERNKKKDRNGKEGVSEGEGAGDSTAATSNEKVEEESDERQQERWWLGRPAGRLRPRRQV